MNKKAAWELRCMHTYFEETVGIKITVSKTKRLHRLYNDLERTGVTRSVSLFRVKPSCENKNRLWFWKTRKLWRQLEKGRKSRLLFQMSYKSRKYLIKINANQSEESKQAISYRTASARVRKYTHTILIYVKSWNMLCQEITQAANVP